MSLVSFGGVEAEQGDDFEEMSAFRGPPPPDDRIWRHPSELAVAQAAATARRARTGTLRLAASASVVGAMGAIVALALTGSLDMREPGPRPPVVRQAVDTRPSDSRDTASGLASELTAPAVVRLDVEGKVSAIGSGVLYRSDGHVVTSAHVVAGSTAISVLLSDGRRVAATLVGLDADRDIAVVRLEADGPFPVAPTASVRDIAVGDATTVLGASRGAGRILTLTTGWVTGLGREVRGEDGRSMSDLLATDALVAPGASGGALVGPDGRVIGITSAFAPAYGARQSEGYATPIDLATAIADDLVDFGAYRPGWLGVRGQDGPRGVVLVALAPDGPAVAAGLKPGDVVLTVDGRSVESMAVLRMEVRTRRPGDVLPLGCHRDGVPFDIDVALGSV